VGYDGQKVELWPQPWRGATWNAGCAVRAFQQEQVAGAPRRRVVLWLLTVALLAAAVALVVWPPMPWKLAALLPGVPELFLLLLATMGAKWGREVREVADELAFVGAGGGRRGGHLAPV
jgi:hypothetical protein